MGLNPEKPTPHGTILLIDDDQDVRMTLKLILDYEGYNTIDVDSSAEALRIVAENPINLVITDMNLGRASCSGIDLIEQIMERDDTIPVILITGYPSIHTAVDAMKRGAIEFLIKPIDRDRLIHLVEKGLQERKLRMENLGLSAEGNNAATIDKLNRKLNERVNELTRLYTISEGLNQLMDSRKLFERIGQLASEVTGAQRVSVMLLDRTRKYLRIRAAIGLPPEVIAQTRTPVGEGITGKVALHGQPIRIPQNVIEPNTQSADGTNHPAYTTQSWLSLPLIIGQEVFGVINLTNKLDQADFTSEDEQIMRSLSEKASTKLENQALYDGIYANLIDTLTSLVTTIEAKDPYTRQHSQRVTEFSMRLGRLLKLSDEEIEMLDFAGMLHDIGKIGVQDGILTKPGKLTQSEYDMVKQHPLIGVKIVEPLGLVPDEISIIRNHHERFDGKGYPDGLAGMKIPLLARVVAVIDAFDAMTTTRSYRQALSVESAVNEMIQNAGTQFDPEIVEVMIKAVENDVLTVSEEIQDLACAPDS